MALTYPAYDYDGYPRSRRPSLPYTNMGYSPYHQPIMYSDHIVPPVGDVYPTPSYSIYGPPTGTLPVSRLPGYSYDDVGIRDGYYDDYRRRYRRRSSVSFASRPTYIDAYYPGSIHIKFRQKGSFMAGITLSEAQADIRLSSEDDYTVHDLHMDRRGTILLRVKWQGYSPVTYEVPLETYDDHVSLQTLARRVARACVHYLQANMVPVPWDRVELHHMEEVSYGVWQPMLTVQ